MARLEQQGEMFKKILVANRGEIAMRIIRACRELNIATAAIYSEADSTGIYVKKADEAYLVGPGPVKGFLDGRQIVDLALRIGADAIHPGYGFLSENAEFARLCHASGITFIGPSPGAITLMGNKVKARELAQSVGVPIVPGTEGGVSDVREALAFAKKAGYPVMIKASAGGGGRGLRVVRSDAELRDNMEVASREAQAHSATVASSSRNISNAPTISSSRFWPTDMEISFILASGIAPFSVVIKSSLRSPRL